MLSEEGRGSGVAVVSTRAVRAERRRARCAQYGPGTGHMLRWPKEQGASVRRSSVRLSPRVLATVFVAVAVVAIDLLSKRLVQQSLELGERRDVVPGLIVLTHVQNTGAAYGLFTGHRWLLVLTATIIAAITPLLLRALPLHGRWAWAGPVLTGMIVGGAAGNLIERARHGYVTDFIQTPPIRLFQVFNA